MGTELREISGDIRRVLYAVAFGSFPGGNGDLR